MKEETRALIATTLKTGWSLSGVPALFDNQANAEKLSTPWVRIVVNFAENQPAAIGTAWERQSGLVMVQVFIPSGGGTSAATKAADELERLLKYKQLPVTVGAKVGYCRFDGANGPYPAGERDGYTQQMITLAFQTECGR